MMAHHNVENVCNHEPPIHMFSQRPWSGFIDNNILIKCSDFDLSWYLLILTIAITCSDFKRIRLSVRIRLENCSSDYADIMSADKAQVCSVKRDNNCSDCAWRVIPKPFAKLLPEPVMNQKDRYALQLLRVYIRSKFPLILPEQQFPFLQSQFFLSQKLLCSELVPVHQRSCLLLIPMNLNLCQGRAAGARKIAFVDSDPECRYNQGPRREGLQVTGNRTRRRLLNLAMSSRVEN
jgi:hypothetical protein